MLSKYGVIIMAAALVVSGAAIPEAADVEKRQSVGTCGQVNPLLLLFIFVS
jgi:tetrahydrodipicolinate N-succinyltransferase